MDSLNQAASVVSAAWQPDGVTPLLVALGFDQRALPLNDASRDRIGLPAVILAADIVTAGGSLRALVIDITLDANIRDCIASVARRLSAHAPQLLWLVIARQRGGSILTIATWHCRATTPTITAMTTERGHVIDSDAETLCALSSARSIADPVMRHLRWLDILGRDAVTQRFFRALATAVTTLATSVAPSVPATDAREIALLTTSRLLFLSFLETKGWLNGDFGFLANGFGQCMASGGSYQRQVLEPLFFGTLNTRVSERALRARAFGRVPFLNGGLFSRTFVERVHRNSRFTDDALGALFGDVLVRYRFTAREETASWCQAAIDPEMLGRVFECLMCADDRKRGGVYYTPNHFVERVTRLTLTALLERHGLSRASADSLLIHGEAGGAPDTRLIAAVAGMRILDPACGSGAFLVHALDRIAHLRVALGDSTPISDIRRSALTQCIFGVDANPTAVWLCQLRLWLSAVIDSDETDPMHVVALPNLDRQIRVGNSLSAEAFTSASGGSVVPHTSSALRDRYTRSTGRRKISLGRRLDVAERTRAISAIDTALSTVRFERGELIRASRTRDLFDSRRPPAARERDRLLQLRLVARTLTRRRLLVVRGGTPSFSYTTHFADVADAGGFDAVIGNPPWVRAHNMSPHDRARYRETFSVCRSSAWAEGARGAHAGAGFAGQTDLAALFLERSAALLAPEGALGMLLPSKLWRSLAGGGARQLALNTTRIVAIEDHAGGPDAFDAAVYPSILIASRDRAGAVADSCGHQIDVRVQRGDALQHWTVNASRLSLDHTPGSPWLLLPPEARSAFDLITDAGVPLFESALGRPHLGVKTGLNAAFIVSMSPDPGIVTSISAQKHRAEIEVGVLRPLVRGETMTRWTLNANSERIIWTHGAEGRPVRTLPPLTYRWLSRYRRALERRTDARSDRWWSLFRTEAADPAMPRVVWSDFGLSPRAAVLAPGDPTVPLNTCYSVACRHTDDALALAAILNSSIAAAWLSVIAEPARGGYHRYLGWTVARLPLPTDWPRARNMLAPVARRACLGDAPTTAALDAVVLDCYHLAVPAVEALLNWVDAHVTA